MNWPLAYKADLLPQEGISERQESGPFLVVLAKAMSSGGGLVEPNLPVPQGLQLRRHLAGVAGMHTIVAARGGDQDRRIRPTRHRLMVGRIGFQPRPLLGLVGIAVFGDP